MTIQEQLIRHESDRQFPYDDATGKTLMPGDTLVGKVSIGIGRNLSDVGLAQDERLYLLENDLARVRSELDAALPWWKTLDSIRQAVMIDLGFNLGVLTPPGTAKLLTWDTTLELFRTGQYEAVADRIATFPWHKQVGSRAVELEAMLRSPVET